jgi:hypothetical protein
MKQIIKQTFLAGFILLFNLIAAENILADSSISSAREKLLQNGIKKIIFNKRYTYQSGHFYTDFIDGCQKFGGNLCILSLKDGQITELVPSMKDGIIGRYDLSFDGKKVVFDWKEKVGKGFRIYEVGIDGKGLRQLTFDPADEAERIAKYSHIKEGMSGEEIDDGFNYYHHTDDMHPVYLPDGGICFISTRCEYGTLCDIPDILTTTVMYRMDGDGSNMVKLTNSALSEMTPSIMNDGRILYTRWEYVDKGTFPAKSLWAMRPDGSGSVEIYGNDVRRPETILYGRAIPGKNNLYIAIDGSHGPLGLGPVFLMDISHPIRTLEPVSYLAPLEMQEKLASNQRGWSWGVENDEVNILYIDPFPISENLFIVSHNTGGRWNDIKGYGLYLIDDSGNSELIYKDSKMSCFQGIPLLARSQPKVVPDIRSTEDKRECKVVMSDVYKGLDGVERGSIKYLRILEQVPRPWAARRRWSGDGSGGMHVAISAETHLGLKVLHGIVPVHEDGSAYFTLPADKSIFFQALDENFMEIQRMRTFVNLRPGETRSCIGCHELRQLAPANKNVIALKNPPVPPLPQPGDEVAQRPIHYPTDVQPILDKHCVSCHSGAEAKAELDLSGEMTKQFSKSYQNILDRRLISVVREERPEWGYAEPVPPKTYGSHASKLISIIRDGHEGVKLSKEEFIKLVTWVDTNAQYYGSYYGRRNIKYKDHPNFRPVPTFAQAISTNAPLEDNER